jgi:hypothetical protein
MLHKIYLKNQIEYKIADDNRDNKDYYNSSMAFFHELGQVSSSHLAPST